VRDPQEQAAWPSSSTLIGAHEINRSRATARMRITMYTLDANIFIRDLDTREPQHAECHTLLDQLQALALPIIVPVFGIG
jgi:hypothetical protein